MSVRRLYPEQPDSFVFSGANLDWAKGQIAKFPQGRQASAVIILLWRAQEQEGWVTEPAIRYIADMLEMPFIRVLEVATFYTMFNLEPVGRHHIQVCGTTPCMLRGSEDLKAVCERRIGPKGHRTADGAFSWTEVECLGACVNAPMIQIDKDYFEDLDTESFEALLDALRDGREVKPGPQNGRQFSAPEGGPLTLVDASIYAPKPYQEEGRVEPTPAPVAAGRPNLGERANQAAADTPGERAVEGKPPIPPEEVARQDKMAEQAPKPPHAEDASPPVLLEAPRGGKADNLKRIRGIGRKLELTLNKIGVYHFDQIASWTPENLRWADANLEGFKGRASRDNWIAQATALVGAGGNDSEPAPENGGDA